MRITSIRRLQWMIVGLIVGLICGGVRDAAMNFSDELSSLGGRRIGQRDFEHALVLKLNGKPYFTDLVVYPYHLGGASGQTGRLHVVYGMYWDGQTKEENGRLAARWEPAYFVASAPYVPVSSRIGSTKSSAAARGRQFDDVLGYLQSLPEPNKVKFQYASWSWLTRPLFEWTSGMFLFIGIIWPTIINLLVFHSLWRKPEPAGESLWNVKSDTSQRKPQAAIADDQTLAVVRSLDEELEKTLSVAAADKPASAQPASPVRALQSAPLQPAAVGPSTAKDFKSKQGDYYPTERRAKHKD